MPYPSTAKLLPFGNIRLERVNRDLVLRLWVRVTRVKESDLYPPLYDLRLAVIGLLYYQAKREQE